MHGRSPCRVSKCIVLGAISVISDVIWLEHDSSEPMDEYDEVYYFRDPEPARYDCRSTFSVVTLFRATTIVAMILGWITLVVSVPSQITQLVVLFTAASLSAMVGYRRFGKRWRRCRAALMFFAGGILIAFYSGYVAHVIQNPIQHDHKWAALDAMFSMIPIIAGFPIAIVVGVFMLRSWVWSANEQSIHMQ